MNQLPGSLPKGASVDSLLTRQEFCTWQRVSADWLRPRLSQIPGVIRQSRQVIRIHPRTYLDKATKGEMTPKPTRKHLPGKRALLRKLINDAKLGKKSFGLCIPAASKPTRDGEGVPTGALCGQLKGANL